jgi:lysine N6-hydroxylase
MDYFFNLPARKKKEVLEKQAALYKGINFSLIAEIYDRLHLLNSSRVRIYSNCELKKVAWQADAAFNLEFYHKEMEKSFAVQSEAVILATGYKHEIPDFLNPVKELISFNADGLYEVNKNYSIDANNSIFVQNADLHTHGFNSADLGMGPYRNAIILNSIIGCEHFILEKCIAFQTFGLPPEQLT